MSDMMTQEEAMNMSNEQAVQILIPMRNMMCDQNGCPISDAVFALDKAIEALSADVAPVVRCRDCKWFGKIGCAIEVVDETDMPKENDFCSFAERKDDDTD